MKVWELGRKVEKLEWVLEGNGLDSEVGREVGKEWVVVVLGRRDVWERGKWGYVEE